MKKLKISVHIPFYLNGDTKSKFLKLNKVCKEYLKLPHKVDIFVHTNKKKKKFSKKIKFIYHDLSNIHPFKLTWICRSLMTLQRNKYDIFIYGEDDLIFTKKNLNYWQKYKDLCIDKKFNLGFLRVEKNKKNNNLYSTDQISKVKYIVKLKHLTFAKLNNPNSSFWIYDKNEFKKFIKTKYWNFKWEWKTQAGNLLIREMAAVGWHGEMMSRYKATIIPLKNNKLYQESYLKHISNNYANNPAGLFGTIKINNLIEDKLELFKEKNYLEKILKKFKFFLYSLLRINFKNFKKLFN